LTQEGTKRLFSELALTGIASVLLNLLAFEADGTKFEWLAILFYCPGLWVADKVFHMGNHSLQFLQVAIVLNFVFIWIIMLLVMKLVEKFVTRLKLKATD
jgi:hypothetical protein